MRLVMDTNYELELGDDFMVVSTDCTTENDKCADVVSEEVLKPESMRLSEGNTCSIERIPRADVVKLEPSHVLDGVEVEDMSEADVVKLEPGHVLDAVEIEDMSEEDFLTVSRKRALMGDVDERLSLLAYTSSDKPAKDSDRLPLVNRTSVATQKAIGNVWLMTRSGENLCRICEMLFKNRKRCRVHIMQHFIKFGCNCGKATSSRDTISNHQLKLFRQGIKNHNTVYAVDRERYEEWLEEIGAPYVPFIILAPQTLGDKVEDISIYAANQAPNMPDEDCTVLRTDGRERGVISKGFSARQRMGRTLDSFRVASAGRPPLTPMSSTKSVFQSVPSTYVPSTYVPSISTPSAASSSMSASPFPSFTSAAPASSACPSSTSATSMSTPLMFTDFTSPASSASNHPAAADCMRQASLDDPVMFKSFTGVSSPESLTSIDESFIRAPAVDLPLQSPLGLAATGGTLANVTPVRRSTGFHPTATVRRSAPTKPAEEAKRRKRHRQDLLERRINTLVLQADFMEAQLQSLKEGIEEMRTFIYENQE